MEIVRLSREHLKQVSRIHKEQIDVGALDLFGLDFLENMYYFLIKNEWGYVAKKENEIVGFICASRKKASLASCLSIYSIIIFFINIFFKFNKFLSFLILFYKIYIKNSWEKKIFSDKKTVELFSIAVKKGYKGKGIGKKLINAFEKKAKINGIQYIFTRTHNQKLEEFYYRNKNAFLIEKIPLRTYDLKVIKWRI